ncbi:hypothetical protein [Deinococcus hopiensis]|uniref:hypothetical protein n=1 Tax=Deinococcus hopiensis TaxID=309885 RepID=UPI000A00F977|nr:hypothetical protein [Deinococcus hopiensis]
MEHAEAVAQFCAWPADPNLAGLDTETTGLEGHVIEIAVCKVQGEVLLDTLVRNLGPIEDGARDRRDAGKGPRLRLPRAIHPRRVAGQDCCHLQLGFRLCEQEKI